jgi:F0F1-type ATP synthase assembly protein I
MAIEDICQLEADLEQRKAELRNDLAQLEAKVHATRTELNPTKLIGDGLTLLAGLAVLVGFVIGYQTVRADQSLAAAGKEGALRAYRAARQ